MHTQGDALRRSIEDALVENPDDLATHAAYADLLHDQGDPRGEFIQVQLALEALYLPDKEEQRLWEREDELFTRHAKEWLGDVGRFLVGDWSGFDKPYEYEIRRGWLDQVRILPAPEAVLAALLRSPESRLLRRLKILYDMRFHPFRFDSFAEKINAAMTAQEKPAPLNSFYLFDADSVLVPLLDAPFLTNLRAFAFGFSDTPDALGHSTMARTFEDCTVEQVLSVLTRWPRLESLAVNTALPGIERLFASPELGRLRAFQYYNGTDYSVDDTPIPYPLKTLAENTALSQVKTLRFHPGRDATIDLDQFETLLASTNLPALEHLQVHMTTFGDDGCRTVVGSGILYRLKSLDLGHGAMTDAGARLLAAAPALKHLDTLDVSRNALTRDGIAALQATGVRVVAENQHAEGDEDYLFEVDFE